MLLRIADLTILFESGPTEPPLNINYPHKNFVYSLHDHIDCSVSIKKGLSRHLLKGKELFTGAGPWCLYMTENNYLFVFSTPTSHNYYMLAEMDKDFSRGKLYIHNGRKKTFIVPHPLDQILIISLLSRGRGLFVHACGINDNGRGLLFLGASGAGKSTTARLWADETGVKVLSDDRIIIREINNSFIAYGTPWHGELNVCDPGSVAIEKMFFLEQSDRNYAKPLSPVEAATKMFVRCFPTFWDKEGMEFTLSFIDRAVDNVRCYELGFVPDKSAISFVRGLE